MWHGNAADVFANIATESVDLVITDPPYGQEWVSGRRKDAFDPLHGDGADAEARDAIRNVLAQCVRAVGQNRHLYIFGPSDVLEGLKVSEAVEMIWDKGTLGAGDLTATWGPAHEPITFCVSKHRHGGKRGTSTVPTRLRKGTVLRHTRPTGRKVRHPSEKPVGLIRELVESSSRVDELVLDPYAGSGSTAVAALIAGRRAVVVESDTQYIPLIVDRCIAAEAIGRRALTC